MSKISDSVRSKFMTLVSDFLASQDFDVLRVKSNTFSIPWVEGEEEGYINLTFSVPKGARDGEGYDGYAEAESFKLDQREKAAKREAAAKKKAAKIAKDKAARDAKRAEAEAEAEAEKKGDDE